MNLPVGQIIQGDCLDVMRGWPDGCVDAVVTDSPYGINFMGKKWDYDVPSVEIWREVYRVLKDGGRLLAFSGARTQHRMVCNIEDAGFVIEDCMMWLYGSGFPKHGSKLKPAFEPLVLARKMHSHAEYSGIMVRAVWSLLCQLKQIAGAAEPRLQPDTIAALSAIPDGVEAASSVPMDMWLSEAQGDTSLSIALSWLHTLVVICWMESKSTIGTECGLTTDLRTLSLLELPNTQAFITPDGKLTSGGAISASSVGIIFSAVRLKLIATLTGSVPGHAISKAAGAALHRVAALNPSNEPIVVARKGSVTALNIDECRLPISAADPMNGAVWTSRPSRIRPGTIGLLTSHRDGERRVIDTSKGRWPANVCLDDCRLQVLRLRYNIDHGAREAIEQFYQDYDGLRSVRGTIPNLPLKTESEQGAVLQSGLLLTGALGPNDRRGASALRQEAQPGVFSQDAADKAAARDGEQGQGQSELQGLLVQPGLQDAEPCGARGAGAGIGFGNDGEGQAGDSGASAGDGGEAGSSVAIAGIGTSCERHEGGQQAGEPDTDGSGGAQEAASGRGSGIAQLTARERSIEVLDRDVPAAWRCYFEPTGIEFRDPDSAAAILDAQSGRSSSSSYRPPDKGGIGNSLVFAHAEGGERGHNDSGGASRFFYCAKANAERTADNTHPTVKPLALMQWLVKLVAPADSVTLDPFAGSGTTCVAAERLGRRWIGIELSEEYCQIARARIAAAQEQIAAEQQKQANKTASLFGEQE